MLFYRLTDNHALVFMLFWVSPLPVSSFYLPVTDNKGSALLSLSFDLLLMTSSYLVLKVSAALIALPDYRFRPIGEPLSAKTRLNPVNTPNLSNQSVVPA